MKSELEKKKSNFPKFSLSGKLRKKNPKSNKRSELAKNKISPYPKLSSALLQWGASVVPSPLRPQALGRGHSHVFHTKGLFRGRPVSCTWSLRARVTKQPVSATTFASLCDPSEKIYLVCTCFKNRVTWYQNNVRHTGKLWSPGGAFWHKAGELWEIMGTPVVAKGKCQEQNLLTGKCLLTLLAYFLDKYGLWN